MRRSDVHQYTLFRTVMPRDRVPGDQFLRPIREMINAALEELDANLERYLILPEKLVTAQRLMEFYTIRSER